MAKLSVPTDELTEFDLPRVCVITGATEGVVFKDVKFQWYPRWVAVLVLLNLLIAAIVAQVLMRKVKGKLPFTEAAFKAWRRGLLFQTLSVLLAIVAFIAGLILAIDTRLIAGLLLMAASIAGPIAVHLTQVRGKAVRCTRIAEGQLELDIPSAEAALAFDAHLHGGRSAATGT